MYCLVKPICATDSDIEKDFSNNPLVEQTLPRNSVHIRGNHSSVENQTTGEIKGIHLEDSPLAPVSLHVDHTGVTADSHYMMTGSQKIEFIYTNIGEAFYATLESCIVITSAMLVPLLIYQGWCFFIPGKYQRERVAFNKVTSATCVYILLCLAFIICWFLPHIYQFLHSFGVDNNILQVRLEARIAPYYSWIFKSTFLFLQLSLSPLVLYFLLKENIITLKWMIGNRQITTIFLLTLAAFFSPPDLWGQVTISGVLFILLECITWLFLYKTSATNASTPKES